MPFSFLKEDAESGCMAMLVCVCLLSLLVISLVFDLCIIIWDVPQHTVSYQMWSIMKDHPSIALLIGVAIGHLFLPMVIHSVKPAP